VKIGITYDLREDYQRQGLSEEDLADFDSLDTIEAIEGALAARAMRLIGSDLLGG